MIPGSVGADIPELVTPRPRLRGMRRGIGTEAVKAMPGAIDASDPAGPLVVQIDRGNAASLALAARMGCRRMRDVAGGERGLALLRRPGPEEPPG